MPWKPRAVPCIQDMKDVPVYVRITVRRAIQDTVYVRITVRRAIQDMKDVPVYVWTKVRRARVRATE